MQYRRMLLQQFPGVPIVGRNYPPGANKVLIATIGSYAFFLGMGVIFFAFCVGPATFRPPSQATGAERIAENTELYGRVGYQFKMFEMLMITAWSMVNIWEQYKKLTGNGVRFNELLDTLDEIDAMDSANTNDRIVDGKIIEFKVMIDVEEKSATDGKVVSVDIEKLHDLSHPRVTYLVGSSASEEIASQIRKMAAAANGPVLVILDSDHSEEHVAKELELYAPLTTVGSYCLVQDGIIDELFMFRKGRPGPLPALEKYLAHHPEFEIDHERCERFLITHHPKGWLKRIK